MRNGKEYNNPISGGSAPGNALRADARGQSAGTVRLSRAVRPQAERGSMTAQGHPRAIFRRAIERGNLVVAEATARELGRISLDEALRLLFLYAEKEPIKFERAALRWLARYVAEGKAVSFVVAMLSVSWEFLAGRPPSDRPVDVDLEGAGHVGW
jgi:hypothetical protein